MILLSSVSLRLCGDDLGHPGMQAYRNSREHLFEELRRLDLMLNLRIMRQRNDPAFSGFNEFRGLFIAEEEIDLMMGRGLNDESGEDERQQTEVSALEDAIKRTEDLIAARTAATLRSGIPLMLYRLVNLFQLAPFDVDVLLVCLAPELDLKYEKLYAYLQNDVTRKKPSVDLVLNLFCRSLDEKVEARARLTKDAPLVHDGLIGFIPDVHTEQQTLLSRFLKIDERLLNYILEVKAADEQLASFTETIAPPRATLAQCLLPCELREKLARLFQRRDNLPVNGQEVSARVFLFEGAAGVGKKFTAEALCEFAGLNLLVADAVSLLSRHNSIESLIARLFREARLQNAAVYVDQAEALLEENEKATSARRTLLRTAVESGSVTFIGSSQSWDQHRSFHLDTLIKILLPVPDFGVRKQLWETFLANSAVSISPDVEIEGLADKFNFTAGKIRKAVVEAQQRALMRAAAEREVSANDLYRAARAQSNEKLSTLAKKIKPLYTWDDIILPPDRLDHLREVCAHALYRQRVFGEWGFNRKISLGKGLSVLFVGQSGTGKTMAAEIIAGELKLDLYKIDLSCIVSKYIGETEKNLSKIFEEAGQSSAVLFFDEADAIFGRRSEVKDSHDRYANIEVNYLLQRVEEYEGTVILASNFQKNIDDAFIRRIRFIIEFPFPEAHHRRRIWQQIFPADTPLGPDIDWDFLADKLKITGGHIKNIALNAAFLAANDSECVQMKHIIYGTRREFQKTGKLCVKADFEQYFDLIAGAEEEEVLV